MILLIDIGNTRIKWAQLDQQGLGVQSAAVHSAWTREDVHRALLRDRPAPDRVLISNVSGERMGALVRDAISDELGMEPEFVRATAEAGGVRSAYSAPAKLGVDRWMAMIGARAIHKGLVCVASIGTAMTIDAVDANGQHLGGSIVAGPDLMIDALLRNTSDIAVRALEGDVSESVFAYSTLGAVKQGAVHALAALIDRSAVVLEQELGVAPTLLLTGGASNRVEPFVYADFESVPDLVLRGLAVLARPQFP